MSFDPADQVRKLVDTAMRDAAPFRRGKVDSMGEDNTVNVRMGSGTINVKCTSGYFVREVGDEVMLVAKPGGGWEVMCQVNADQAELIDTAAVSAIAAKLIKALRTELVDKIYDASQFTVADWGTTAPTGFTKLNAPEVWVKDNGGGSSSVYFVTADSASSTKPPRPPADSGTPDDSVINPSDRGAWRSGQSDDTVKQGSWSGADWTGGLFYEGKISSAASGKTVKKMTLKITRTNDGSGWNRAVSVRMALHGRSSTGKPSATTDYRTIARLKPGQAVTVTLPSSWAAALAGGSAKGFVMYDSGSDNYMKFGGSTGRLTIEYN